MSAPAPHYVKSTLDEIEKVRVELISSAARSYQLATGAVRSAATQVKPDLQALVDRYFGTVEAIVRRSHSWANSLVAATDRVRV
jgi:hypothetical protein